jgi:hypothetical protein
MRECICAAIALAGTKTMSLTLIDNEQATLSIRDVSKSYRVDERPLSVLQKIAFASSLANLSASSAPPVAENPLCCG